MESVFTQSFFLSAGETNAEQEMSLPVLVSKLIDIATAHANSLGIGNPSMAYMNAGWVLSRLTIEVDEYPKVNETYVISTWIETFNRHFSERAFKICSSAGKLYGYARSIWMVMDTVKHTNVGLSHLNLSEEYICGEKAPIARQAKHMPIIEADCVAEVAKGALTATHPAFDYRFKYCDLDSYRHVNTIRYVILLLNRFSLEEHDLTFVKRLELSFMHEAKYGMDTKLLRADDDNRILSSFLLCDASDSAPLFFARLFREHRNCIKY